MSCPALSPRREEGLIAGSSLSKCVWGAVIFVPPFDPHPELSAATPGAPVPLEVGEALTAGLPFVGTGGVEGEESIDSGWGWGLEKSQSWCGKQIRNP
jgi:hypothetical protein